MNNNKILVLTILIIFCVGMTMGSATASHTFTKGKYSVKLSNKEYNQIKNNRQITHTIKWTGKYKYVTKKSYKYKNVCWSEDFYSSDWSDYTIKNHKDKYQNKKGWKYYGSFYKEYNGGHHVKFFHKYKKLVKKTVKRKVYMTVSYDSGHWYKTIWTKA